MRALLLIAVSSFAAIAGAWIGVRRHPRDAPPDVAPTAASQRTTTHHGTLTRLAGEKTAHDERFSRLLSALLEPDRLQQRHQLYEAIGSPTPADFESLIARAKKLPLAYRDAALAALVERWFEVDAMAARNWIRRHQNTTFAEIYARREPQKVINELFALRSENPTHWDLFCLTIAIDEIVGPDGTHRIARLKLLPEGKMRDKLAARLLVDWGVSEPLAALQSLDTITDKRIRDGTRNDLLKMVAGKDPLKAFELAGELLPHLDAGAVGNGLLTEIADAAAENDPQATLRFAERLPPEFRYYPSVAAARALAKTDPVGALNWCVDNGIDIARGLRFGAGGGWTGAVLKEAMLNHPRETIDWVTRLAPGAERDRLLERAFFERLSNLPAEKLFTDGNDYVLDLYRHLPPEARPRTADDLSRQRATRPDFTNPDQWLAQFRTPEERASGIHGMILGINSRDTQQAEALAESFTAPLDRDAALGALVVLERVTNPESAGTRAIQISDPMLRKDALQDLIPLWMKRDQAGCEAWLTAHQQTIPRQWVDRWTARE